MANNRMYLREKRTGEIILLCKYYPTPGWFLYPEEKAMNDWLEKVREKISVDIGAKYDYMWGPTSFELVFEVVEEGSKELKL